MSGVPWRVQVAGGWMCSRPGRHLGQGVGVTGAWAQLEHDGEVGGGHLGHGDPAVGGHLRHVETVVAWLQEW